jgi:uncharacterized membrane protein (DUF485 family)
MESVGIVGGIIFLYVAFIVIVILVSWWLGKLLGKHLSKTTGLIIGIVLILCGFSLFVGIPCIIYSSKNKDKSLDLDFNINSILNTNKKSNIQETVTINNNDTRECPFCAEIIKKKATVCRFCGKTVEPIV